jgi:oligopeptide/dipeptide ABC transporter ATP-binding protein
LWGELRGCRFADRCPLATDTCRAVEPPLVEHKPGHFAACHYAGADLPAARVQ